MDTSQPDKLFEDVQSVVSELPKPISSFLTDGSVETAAKTITQKNHLHADQGAIVEKELLLTLMGIQEPSALSETLKNDAELDENTLNSILSDMNELVFSPLHESMRVFDAKASSGVAQNSVEEPAATGNVPTRPQEPPPIPLRPKDSRPIIKEYAVDPYRESVDVMRRDDS